MAKTTKAKATKQQYADRSGRHGASSARGTALLPAAVSLLLALLSVPASAIPGLTGQPQCVRSQTCGEDLPDFIVELNRARFGPTGDQMDMEESLLNLQQQLEDHLGPAALPVQWMLNHHIDPDYAPERLGMPLRDTVPDEMRNDLTLPRFKSIGLKMRLRY